MLKMERDYIDQYGDIPSDYDGRLNHLLGTVDLSKTRISVFDKIKKILSIKWKTTSFTIYLLPKATPRPRVGSAGIFYVKGAKDNKDFLKKYIIDQNPEIIFTPVKFTCISYLPIPKTMSSVEKVAAELGFIRPISKPDWDNVGKAYCDMIQGMLIYDDSLIVDGVSKKFYSVKPRIEITLSWMEDFDSDFNRKKMLKKKGGMNK
jgi:Holliday junction resolvase RusA-like endonuclease